MDLMLKTMDINRLPKDGSNVEVIINPKSQRLQLLTPFDAWDGKNISGAKLLIKSYKRKMYN